MESLATNLDLYVILKNQEAPFDHEALLTAVVSRIDGQLTEEEYDTLKEFCRRFSRAASERWKKCRRDTKKFRNTYEDWLMQNVDWPSFVVLRVDSPTEEQFDIIDQEPSTSSVGTMTTINRKPFEDLGTKQKKKRLSELLAEDADELAYAAAERLKQDGRDDFAAVIEFVLKNPEAASTLREQITKMTKKPGTTTLYTEEKALSLYISIKLSKWQYTTLRESAIREGAEKMYPSYYGIQKAKLVCYPPKETVTVTDSSAKITLQGLLNTTVKRILDSIQEDIEDKQMVLISKWGFDGASSQSRYKQKMNDSEQDDSSIFMTTLVPLKLTSGDDTVWTNPKPCSASYCRPIQFIFIKESEAVVLAQKMEMDKEIEDLQPTEHKSTTVKHELKMTMLDGKICTYLSKARSNATCSLFLAKPTEMNCLDKVLTKPVDTDIYEYGLSSLHARINTMECLLHIAYRLDFKQWAARGNELKEKMASRKKMIQERFMAEMNLLIDVVKQGSGTTNDGNTARKFFQNPGKTARITGLDEELIRRFAVIVQAITSGEVINVEKYREYPHQTVKKYVELYNWYHMSATVHKLLVHGADIIAHNAVLPIGCLSEEASEARNKDFRRFREHNSQKKSRQDSNRDILNMLLLSSDPKLTAMRPTLHKRKRQTLFTETLNLLDDSESENQSEMMYASEIDSDFEVDDEISDAETEDIN